jgi:hypothetical protein
MQAHLYCHHICYRNHHCCQQLLLILSHLSTTPISHVMRVVLLATSVPTTTVTIIRTGLTTVVFIPQLLPTRGRAIDSRTGIILGLDNGHLPIFLRRMSSVNYAQPSATQLHKVPSFTAVASSPLSTLLLGMFMFLLGSQTPAQTNTLQLTLQLWLILHSILVIIICMLVTVKALPYHILDIPHYIPQNAFLNYLTFFICLILPNHSFLFRNFIVIIMFILNFMNLCFMSRIPSPKKCSFPVRVMMVSISYLSLLPFQSLKPIVLLTSPRLLLYGIVDWVILLPVFLICYFLKIK